MKVNKIYVSLLFFMVKNSGFIGEFGVLEKESNITHILVSSLQHRRLL
jgi:hypothetical protein